MKIKKISAIATAIGLFLGNCSFSAYADDENCIHYVDTSSYCTMSGDKLFENYFIQKLNESFDDKTGVNSYVTLGTTARNNLTTFQKQLYDNLRTKIEGVANGTQSSTEISINIDMSGVGQDVSDTIRTSVWALIYDNPNLFYWYTNQYDYFWSSQNITIRFPVSSSYSLSGEMGTYITDTAKTSVASTVINNISNIVDTHKNESDFDKLKSYKKEICDLVSYDHNAAVSANYNNSFQPWQIIYVFDGDPATNVVCEGYSKAFKYLCDISVFSQNIECWCVSGYMDGGAHMWNNVRIGASNYMADVTNCDSETIGADEKLFLVGMVGDPANGYEKEIEQNGYLYNIEYVYNDMTCKMYTTSQLAISDKDYTGEVSVPATEVEVADGIYTISTLSGKALDVTGGSISNGAKLQVCDNYEMPNQKFRIKSNSSGYYSIENVNSGKVLDIEGASASVGARIQQYDNYYTDNQLWKFYDAGNGNLYIQSKNGVRLAISGETASNGSAVITATPAESSAQMWILTRQSEVSSPATEVEVADGIYTISTLNRKALDVTGGSISNGAKLQVCDNYEMPNQKFRIKSNSSGYYSIENVNSGKVLDIEGASASVGARIQQYDNYYTDNQLWKFYDAGNGNLYIQSKNGVRLAISGETASNGSAVITATPAESSAQMWILTRQSEISSPAAEVEIADGIYTISTLNRKALDVTGGSISNGAKLQVYDYYGLSNQKFLVRRNSSGYYSIENVNSGKVLDIEGASASGGARIQQYDNYYTDNQLWKFYDAGNGSLYIQSKNGVRLAISGETASNGSAVITATPAESSAQMWILTIAI